MGSVKISYFYDIKDYLRKMEKDNQLILDHNDYSGSETCNYHCSLDEDYYLEDDFSSFKDVARSKKFYLKKRVFDEPKIDELEDVFMERIADEEIDSEGEKIIQVVWSDDEPEQNKLVRFIENSDVKKSNSKFTFSMLDEDRGGAVEVDSSEGEEIRGRFLEVKDSLEVIATSSRSLHGSEWDFSTEEEPGVNKIWRKKASPWTSSLQIEIGKLPSDADQETVLQVLDDGAQGKISVRDVTECLGNLLEKVQLDYEDPPTKKVSFCDVPSTKSISSKSSQSDSQSHKGSSQKKVSFPIDFSNNVLSDDALDKPVKKVSFYELAFDEYEAASPSDYSKIKKTVSFHDSVEFEKSDKSNDDTLSDDDIIFADFPNPNSKSFPFRRDQEISTLDVVPNTSLRDKLRNNIPSGFSLAETISTFSVQTLSNEGSTADVSACHEFSDYSLPNSGDDKKLTINFMAFPQNQLSLVADHEFSGTDNILTQKYDTRFESQNDCLNKLMKDMENSIKLSETNLEKMEFIKSLIEDSLNRKFNENVESVLDVPANSTSDEEEREDFIRGLSGFSNTLKLLYNQCREIVDINSLSKTMGLAMSFQDAPVNFSKFQKNETITKEPLAERSSDENRNHTKKNDSKPHRSFGTKKKRMSCRPSFLDDDYLSANSDNEIQANFSMMPDPFISLILNKYIFLDYPPLHKPCNGSLQDNENM